MKNGVMECWSSGVMVKTNSYEFSITPSVLQYSNAPNVKIPNIKSKL